MSASAASRTRRPLVDAQSQCNKKISEQHHAHGHPPVLGAQLSTSLLNLPYVTHNISPKPHNQHNYIGNANPTQTPKGHLTLLHQFRGLTTSNHMVTPPLSASHLMAPPSSGPTPDPYHSIAAVPPDGEEHDRGSPSAIIILRSSRGHATNAYEASREDSKVGIRGPVLFAGGSQCLSSVLLTQ